MESITADMAEDFLLLQKNQRSANAANKDRKNLLAMFSKGVKTYGLRNNPFVATEKFPHDRSPQYGAHIYYSKSRKDIARWILDRAIKFYRVMREAKR